MNPQPITVRLWQLGDISHLLKAREEMRREKGDLVGPTSVFLPREVLPGREASPGSSPAYVGTYHVPIEPVAVLASGTADLSRADAAAITSDGAHWSVTGSADRVRVPLFPLEIPSETRPSAIFMTGFTWAAQMLTSCPSPSGVSEVTVCLGYAPLESTAGDEEKPAEEVAADPSSRRLFIGAAFRQRGT